MGKRAKACAVVIWGPPGGLKFEAPPAGVEAAIPAVGRLTGAHAEEAAPAIVIKGDGLVVESGQLGEDSLLDVEEVNRLTGAPVDAQ